MSTDDVTGQLRMLTELREAGAISEEELTLAKARLFGGGAGAPAGAAAVGPVGGPAAHTGQLPAPVVPRAADAGGGHAGRPGGGPVIFGGALLLLLAFVALPLATSRFFGSITAPGLAVEGARSGQGGIAGLLWFVPVLALAIAGTAAWLHWGSGVGGGQRRTGAAAAIAMAGVVVLVYTVVIGSLGGTAVGVSFTGAGLIFALIGAATVAVGGAMILSAPGRVLRSAASPTGGRPSEMSVSERLARPVLIGGYEMPLAVPVVAGGFVGLVLLLIVVSTAF